MKDGITATEGCPDAGTPEDIFDTAVVLDSTSIYGALTNNATVQDL